MLFLVIIFFCIFGGTAMKTGDLEGFMKGLIIFLIVAFVLYAFGACAST